VNAGFVTPWAFSRIVLSVDDLDFAQVYERHARDIYRFSVYLSGDVHVAEEVTAETFARAWASRDRVRLGSVKAYLLMIARNLIRDTHRAPAVSSLPGDTAVADQAADQERAAHARQEWRTVQRALAGLPEVDRAILLMATMEGLSHQEIAESVGLSVTAVKVRIHRARVRLNAARGHTKESS